MRIDWYAKGVLTAIAVLLAVIAIRPYASPDAVAQAQGSFAGVQFAKTNGTESFFDPRTGEVWIYGGADDKPDHYRLTKLGAPMILVK